MIWILRALGSKQKVAAQVSLLGFAVVAWGEAPQVWVPDPVTEEDYQEMKENSPFTRSLNLSDSLLLTGIASIENEVVLTLVDKNTKETYVVTGQPNAQGWKMMGVEGGPDNLEKVTAKISVPGGEVVAVRFDEKQLKPGTAKPAAGQVPGPGPGGPGGRSPGPPGDRDGGRDGGRGSFGPPSDIREKFGQISEDQRRRVFDKLGEMRQKNPEMSREEMGVRMRELLDREISGGR